jgi:hypothetical protein
LLRSEGRQLDSVLFGEGSYGIFLEDAVEGTVGVSIDDSAVRSSRVVKVAHLFHGHGVGCDHVAGVVFDKDGVLRRGPVELVFGWVSFFYKLVVAVAKSEDLGAWWDFLPFDVVFDVL